MVDIETVLSPWRFKKPQAPMMTTAAALVGGAVHPLSRHQARIFGSQNGGNI
ncbi:protein of unknown function [Burkholderia multivorans]